MVTFAFPFDTVDLPGELVDEPPAWEEMDDPDCGLCCRAGADDTGLCQHCADRLPRVGGCGKGPVLVAALAGVSVPETPLAHLTRCADCREFFDTLAEVGRVAHIEADRETPHAAGLAITAA